MASQEASGEDPTVSLATEAGQGQWLEKEHSRGQLQRTPQPQSNTDISRNPPDSSLPLEMSRNDCGTEVLPSTDMCTFPMVVSSIETENGRIEFTPQGLANPCRGSSDILEEELTTRTEIPDSDDYSEFSPDDKDEVPGSTKPPADYFKKDNKSETYIPVVLNSGEFEYKQQEEIDFFKVPLQGDIEPDEVNSTPSGRTRTILVINNSTLASKDSAPQNVQNHSVRSVALELAGNPRVQGPIIKDVSAAILISGCGSTSGANVNSDTTQESTDIAGTSNTETPILVLSSHMPSVKRPLDSLEASRNPNANKSSQKARKTKVPCLELEVDHVSGHTINGDIAVLYNHAASGTQAGVEELPVTIRTISQRSVDTVMAGTKEESTIQASREQMVSVGPKRAANNSFNAPEGSQSKDVLMAELKTMKIASITARNTAIEAEIADKRAKLEEISKDLEYPAADTVKNHIKYLHDYNDIRDVGQGLVGMIADNRGVRIGELYDEFGVGLKD